MRHTLNQLSPLQLVGESAPGAEQDNSAMLVSRLHECPPPTSHIHPDARAKYSDFLQDGFPGSAMVVAPTMRGMPRSDPARSLGKSYVCVSLFTCIIRLHAASSTSRVIVTGVKTARRHSVNGAETGFGDAAGRNLLVRRHSTSDILVEQSDFGNNNRDPNKVVAIVTPRGSMSPP